MKQLTIILQGWEDSFITDVDVDTHLLRECVLYLRGAKQSLRLLRIGLDDHEFQQKQRMDIKSFY